MHVVLRHLKEGFDAVIAARAGGAGSMISVSGRGIER